MLVFIKKIYIVGAGIAGLSFFENYPEKKNIIFIEKNDYIGGRIKTICSGSSYFEIGSQFFCKSDKSFWNLIEKKNLNKDVFKLDFSNISFYNQNKLYSDLNEIVYIIEQILEDSNEKDKDGFFDSWFLKNFDKNKLFIPKGIIKAITFSNSVDTLAYYGRYILSTFFEDCFTFQYGLEELVNSLSENIKIQRNSVQKYIFKDNKIIEILTENSSIDVSKDIVISTAPPGDIEIKNNQILSEMFKKIKFCGCGVVIYKIKEDFVEKPDYIFFPENKYRISVIEQLRIGDDKFIGCLIPYHKGSLDQKEIIDFSKKFLGKILGCDMNKRIIETFYWNWKKGLPIVNKEYVNTVSKLNDMAFENLFFAGDYSSLYPSMESAVKSGLQVAQEI